MIFIYKINLRWQRFPDLFALLELLLGSLVRDEDLDHVAEWLLSSGRKSADLGASLVGMGLQDTVVNKLFIFQT